MDASQRQRLFEWLLEGDPAIRFQVHRDLLLSPSPELDRLRSQIGRKGWGARYLEARNEDGSWGLAFYRPKWTSSHYTLLDLMTLGLPQSNKKARKSVAKIFADAKSAKTPGQYRNGLPSPDVCVNGMVLSYASYFRASGESLEMLLDYLLGVQMKDGGWNCRHERGATHSSLHTTLSVIEAFFEYSRNGGTYRESEVASARKRGEELILVHSLYKSHKTGETIDPKMLMLSFPPRWRYDILRCLDYLRLARRGLDERMEPAIAILMSKQREDGTWPLQAKHPGKVHFSMESEGKPSRWNTLRAIRVLDRFGKVF